MKTRKQLARPTAIRGLEMVPHSLATAKTNTIRPARVVAMILIRKDPKLVPWVEQGWGSKNSPKDILGH